MRVSVINYHFGWQKGVGTRYVRVRENVYYYGYFQCVACMWNAVGDITYLILYINVLIVAKDMLSMFNNK